ncbi:unnamed protein product [Pleuronectes platessa]|uniref:Uncharacterized protein n=1 Tax=Pleuronectes platessa TaxID=8262 RepID=A0A9N7UBW3_PLEPL|nr:unnamed protein product [Pleuronectes platessa]
MSAANRPVHAPASDGEKQHKPRKWIPPSLKDLWSSTDRYLCQLVSEPQVHRCASAECDELSVGICLGMVVPQRAALCSVEMRSLDGRQQRHHLRADGPQGQRGSMWDCVQGTTRQLAVLGARAGLS